VFDLLLITPDREPDAILAQARRALSAPSALPGRVALQLRSKQLKPAERASLGQTLRALCRERGAPFLVNADLELARQLAADGVQLPEAGPDLAAALAFLPGDSLIGVSRHDAAGVRAAAGASFVLLGPVFSVPGKGPALGLDGLASLAAHSPVPVVALGGIDAGRAHAVRAAGAQALAVIREVFDAADATGAVETLLLASSGGLKSLLQR
jgi:thiamine-phosphate pyrophosphorylase